MTGPKLSACTYFVIAAFIFCVVLFVSSSVLAVWRAFSHFYLISILQLISSKGIQDCNYGISTCPSGWTFFELTDSCYKVGHERNWADAQTYCENHDANLASVHSIIENAFVNRLCSTGMLPLNGSYAYLAGHFYCWIGLYKDQSDNNKLKFTDGSQIGFSMWKHGEPSSERERCVQTYSDYYYRGYFYTGNYVEVWNDISCHLTMKSFVCKKDAVVV